MSKTIEVSTKRWNDYHEGEWINIDGAKSLIPLGMEEEVDCDECGAVDDLTCMGCSNNKYLVSRFKAKSKPLELWVNVYPELGIINTYDNKEEAIGSINAGAKTAHMIEVVEDAEV